MPVITLQIAGPNDANLQTSVTFVRIGDAGRRSSVALSRGLVSTTTDSGGAGTVTLNGGTWRMEWYVNGLRSELILGVPGTGGPFELGYVAVSAEVAGSGSTNASITWFGTIAAMLAADSATWSLGRTLNSYGTDGIRTAWDRLLKSDPSAAGISANGDSILNTTDNLAYAIRGAIYS